MHCFFGPGVDEAGRFEAWVLPGHLQDLANGFSGLHFDRIAGMIVSLGGLDDVTNGNS